MKTQQHNCQGQGWGLCVVTPCTAAGTRVGGVSVEAVMQLGQGSVSGAPAPTCSSCWAQAYTILWAHPALNPSLLSSSFSLQQCLPIMWESYRREGHGRSCCSFCLGPGFYVGNRGCWFFQVPWGTQGSFLPCCWFTMKSGIGLGMQF